MSEQKKRRLAIVALMSTEAKGAAAASKMTAAAENSGKGEFALRREIVGGPEITCSLPLVLTSRSDE